MAGIDVSDIARMVGVSRQTATELVDSASDFPLPLGDVAERPVWPRQQVEVWLATHPHHEAAWTRPWSARRGRPTAEVFAILRLAVKQSQELNHGWVGEEHLLLALLQPDCPGMAREGLESFGITLEATRRALLENADQALPRDSSWKPLSRFTQYLLERATLKATELRDEHVSGEHALLALLQAPDNCRALLLLVDRGIDAGAVARRLIALTDRVPVGSQRRDPAAPVSTEVDAAGVARILGLSRKRIAKLTASAADFPSSHLGPRGYRMWLRPAIEAWAVAHPERGPGRQRLSLPVPGTVEGETEQILEIAKSEARELRHDVVLPDHLFLALLHPKCAGVAQATLESLGLTLEEVRGINAVNMGDLPVREVTIPPATHLVLERAILRALDLEDEEVTAVHILLALMDHWDGCLPLGWARPEIRVATLHDHLMIETDGMMPV